MSASLLVPLSMASPMLKVGPYGFSVAEVLVVLAGAYYLAVHGFNIKLPRFVIAYLLLYLAGRLTSLYTAPAWGIPVGIERLSFLYLLALPVLAYYIGRCSRETIEEIATGRPAVVMMCALGLFSAVYPLLDGELRKSIMYWFVIDVSDRRYDAARFPGMGINANIYAFTVFVVLLFSFSAYLKGKGSLVVPLCAAVTILMCGSRLGAFFAVAGCALLWGRRWVAERRRRRRGARVSRSSVRVLVYLGLAVVCVTLLVRYFVPDMQEMRRGLVLVEKIQNLMQPSDDAVTDGPMQIRLAHWKLGMQRVALAPFLGIATNIWLQDDVDILLFAAPHNEFIFYWTAFGLLGLLAHCVLVGSFLVVNVRRKADPAWVILCVALVVQMMFDGAFQSVRFLGLFFILVGLNMTELKLAARQRLVRSGPARHGFVLRGARYAQ